MTPSRTFVVPILTVSVIVLLLIGAYVGAYIGTATKYEDLRITMGQKGIDRTYRYELALTLFRPAAWIESKLRGGIVVDLLFQGGPGRPPRIQNVGGPSNLF